MINIKENERSEISIESLFGGCVYVVSDTSSSASLVDQVNKALRYDGSIFVSDSRAIYRYDSAGVFCGMINRNGRGGEEYIGIKDFVVQNDKVYVLDQNKRLVSYTLDGKYVKASVLDFYPASMTALEDGSLLLTSAYQSEEDKFHVYDGASITREYSFIPVEKNQITWRHFLGQKNFFRYGRRLLFHEPMNNTVYQIKGKEAIPYKELDLFNRNAPKKFWQQRYKNVADIFNRANELKYCFGMPEYCETDDVIWFTYRDGPKYHLCHYSKKTGHSVQSDYLEIPGLSARIPVGDVRFSLEGDGSRMIVITGDMIEPAIKEEVLHVPGTYDRLIFIRPNKE